ncbi:MAG: hypothetical protein M3Y17_13530, partial [Actinomycetota bacterium]|nr:hypothetical protein [Actinomycetota bacterium]
MPPLPTPSTQSMLSWITAWSTQGDPVPLPSGVDTNPLATALQSQARQIAPDAFGGMYHDGDLYYVGFSKNVDQSIGQLRLAFPNVQLQGFLARHTSDELRAIHDQLTNAMISDTSNQILSVSTRVSTNIVNVGVTDPSAPLAQAIASQYGDAVHVFEDQPIELVSNAGSLVDHAAPYRALSFVPAATVSPDVAPGAGDRVNPIQGGRGIYSKSNAAPLASPTEVQ